MAIKTADQISIVDVTDAYSVILTSEAYTFPGSTSAALGGSTTTQIIAMCGDEQVNANVVLSEVEAPAGVTVTKDSSTSSPTLTVAVANTVQTGGKVTIPVHITGTEVVIGKEFTFAIAFKGAKGDTGDTGSPGAAGRSITGVSSKYALNNSATTAPTTWADTPSAPTSSNKYLWSYEIITYSSGNPTETEPHVIGTFGSTGSTGTAGSVWYTGTGVTGTSATATVFSGSGVSSAKVNDMYLNTSTGNTYKCTVAGAAAAAKWVYTGNIKGVTGATGAAGADAITMSITSSNGTIFKNTAIATVLTAHVYKAGAEVTGAALTALGTIKWYKDGSSTVEGTGQTLTIDAGDVTNKATYLAQLEA